MPHFVTCNKAQPSPNVGHYYRCVRIPTARFSAGVVSVNVGRQKTEARGIKTSDRLSIPRKPKPSKTTVTCEELNPMQTTDTQQNLPTVEFLFKLMGSKLNGLTQTAANRVRRPIRQFYLVSNRGSSPLKPDGSSNREVICPSHA